MIEDLELLIEQYKKSPKLYQAIRYWKNYEENSGVKKPLMFDDYMNLIKHHKLLVVKDVYEAHRKLNQSGGYFQALWSK